MGIDKFREHFAGREDEHAIIGRAACDRWFNAAGLEFKDAKDTDMSCLWMSSMPRSAMPIKTSLMLAVMKFFVPLSAAGSTHPVVSRRPAP